TVLLLTWINVRGVKTAAIIQTTLTSIKTLSLAALVLLGVTVARHADVAAVNFGSAFWPAGGLTLALLPIIGGAMVGSLFSMDAWNNVGFAAAEMKNPQKDLPFAMGAGVVIVVTIYLLANVAYLSVLPLSAVRAASTGTHPPIGAAALQAMFGRAGLTLMAIAVMISTFGCNNGLILAGARVYYAMAGDGLFFRKAATLHPVHRTPSFALIAQMIWTCLLCLSGSYGDLLEYVIIAALLFYLLTAIGLFALRRSKPDLPRPIRAPGYPWLPGFYLLATLVFCVNLLFVKPLYTWPGLIIVLIGVPVYFIWRKVGGGSVRGDAAI
ncbi:MAG TPA: amino acid permease, partial [Gemmatimonadales bacterium]